MREFTIKIIKKHYLFFILIPVVAIAQYHIFKPQLLMGLRDIDEAYTVDFLTSRELYPNILEFLINGCKKWGYAYCHQVLYPGILYLFFADNVVNYHIVTLVFKILAVLSVYIPFYIISGSTLIAFISTLLYAFTSVGITNFNSVAQSSDYLAIVLMSIFLSIYFYLVKKDSADFKKVIIALPILLATLIFSTERTFPLVILIFLIEIGLIVLDRSKSSIKVALVRGGILLSPIFLLVALQPIILTQFTKPAWNVLVQRVHLGYREELLIPFISFSSTFLPSRFWALLNQALPLSLMMAIMLSSALVLSSRPLRFILIILSVWIFGAVVVHLLSYHTDPSYFMNHSKTARAGFYMLGLGIAFFVEWLKRRDRLYLGLFLGPFSALVFIYFIWFGGERQEYVRDTHRYLATAIIFSSFFLGNFISLVHKRLQVIFPPFTYMPFLLVIPYLVIGPQIAHQYMNEKLQIGLGRSDQIYMRQQFLPYYQNLDPTYYQTPDGLLVPNNRRLFYIDTYTDMKNHGFYGSTIYSAHTAWPIYWSHLKGWKPDQMPFMEREFDRIEVVFKEGKGVGFLHYGIFYKVENFFAFQLIDKKVIDVTDKVRDVLLNGKEIKFPTYSNR